MTEQLLQELIRSEQPINITLSLSDLKDVVRMFVHDERRRIDNALESEKQIAALTTDEVSALIGVSRSTINRLVKDGQLKAYKIGSKVRFRQTDVESYLEDNIKRVRLNS